MPPVELADAGPRRSLLTVDEVAETLRVSRRTVFRLIHTGRLCTVRIPGLRVCRVFPSDVETLIQNARLGHDRGKRPDEARSARPPVQGQGGH